MAWPDAIRIRVELAPKIGEIPIQSWDETPLWEDSLDNEPTVVPASSESVATNVSHAATQNKYTVMLSSITIKGHKTALLAVIFEVPTGGKRVKKGTR